MGGCTWEYKHLEAGECPLAGSPVAAGWGAIWEGTLPVELIQQVLADRLEI